jgi:hypothetical protein
LLGNYTGKEIAEELIEHIDSDDAADVIAELSEELRREVLANIERQAEQRSEIADLLTYDEHTAGGLDGQGAGEGAGGQFHVALRARPAAARRCTSSDMYAINWWWTSTIKLSGFHSHSNCW